MSTPSPIQGKHSAEKRSRRAKNRIAIGIAAPLLLAACTSGGTPPAAETERAARVATIDAATAQAETTAGAVRKADLAPVSPQRDSCVALAEAANFEAAIRPCLAALAADPGDPKVQGAVRKIQSAMSDMTAAERREAREKSAAAADETSAAAGWGSARTTPGSADGKPAGELDATGDDRAVDEAARAIAERLGALRAAEKEAARRTLGQ